MGDGNDYKRNYGKNIISKSNLPVCEYTVNPYVGCTHACKYGYASFMKRFTNHPEPWGEFLDIKHWDKIKNPKKYAGRDSKRIYLSDEILYRARINPSAPANGLNINEWERFAF